MFPLCFFWPDGWRLQTRWQVESRVTKMEDSLGSNQPVTQVRPHLTADRLFSTWLTSFAILPSKPKRAVTTEGAPQVHAGPSVQTRVVVAEVSFGGASWEGERIRGWFTRLICPTSLFHQSSKESEGNKLFIAGTTIISHRLHFPAVLIIIIVILFPLPVSLTRLVQQ